MTRGYEKRMGSGLALTAIIWDPWNNYLDYFIISQWARGVKGKGNMMGMAWWRSKRMWISVDRFRAAVVMLVVPPKKCSHGQECFYTFPRRQLSAHEVMASE